MKKDKTNVISWVCLNFVHLCGCLWNMNSSNDQKPNTNKTSAVFK